MAKSRKQKAGAGTDHRARHKKNPFRRRRHSRNPFPTSLVNGGKLILSGALGALAAAKIPNMLLPMIGLSDSGVTGYLGNALVAFLPPWFLSKFPNLSLGWLVGGGAMLLSRIVDDVTGTQYLVIGPGSGLSGFQASASAVPLGGGGPNVFGPYSRAAQRLLTAGAVAQTQGGRAAAGSPVMAGAAGSPTGLGWVRPFAA